MTEKPETKSADLLSQPLTDDDAAAMSGAAHIEAFLGGKPVHSSQAPPAPNSNAPVAQGPVEETPRAPAAVQEESVLEQQIKAAQAELDLTLQTPQEKYRRHLKNAGISLSEARRIVDCIVVQMKPWSETYLIGPSNTRVTLKTRMPEDEERLRRVIEEKIPQFQATRDFETAKYNLAASLVEFRGQVFQHNTEDDLLETVEWLKRIPYPLFSLLNQKLWVFDNKIGAVFQEGYLENF